MMKFFLIHIFFIGTTLLVNGASTKEVSLKDSSLFSIENASMFLYHSHTPPGTISYRIQFDLKYHGDEDIFIDHNLMYGYISISSLNFTTDSYHIIDNRLSLGATQLLRYMQQHYDRTVINYLLLRYQDRLAQFYEEVQIEDYLAFFSEESIDNFFILAMNKDQSFFYHVYTPWEYLPNGNSQYLTEIDALSNLKEITLNLLVYEERPTFSQEMRQQYEQIQADNEERTYLLKIKYLLEAIYITRAEKGKFIQVTAPITVKNFK